MLEKTKAVALVVGYLIGQGLTAFECLSSKAQNMFVNAYGVEFISEVNSFIVK